MAGGELVRALARLVSRRSAVRSVLRVLVLDLVGRAAGTVLVVVAAALAVQRWGWWAGLLVVVAAIAGPPVATAVEDLGRLHWRARRVAATRRRAERGRADAQTSGSAGSCPPAVAGLMSARASVAVDERDVETVLNTRKE